MNNPNNIHILSPSSARQFEAYYEFRWQLLRKPWKQDKSSAQDKFEDNAVHRMAVSEEKIIAVGRLHYINSETAQIRYMAVKKEFEHQGVGKKLYDELEQVARKKNINLIILNAREQAVGFYKKMGFQLIKKTHLLFNEIQHYELQKKLKK